MVKKMFLVLTLLCVFVLPVFADASPDFETGQWEVTVEFDIPGMPMKMPANTYQQCMSEDSFVPKDEKPNQKCETRDVRTKGNTVYWKMACINAGGKMTGEGSITYRKDKMDGTMTMKGQGMEMISRFTGKRIGDCN